MGGESIAQILGGDSAAELSGEKELRVEIGTEGTAAEEVLFESRVNPVTSSSTLVKIMEDGRHGLLLLGVTPVETPVKRVSNVMYADGQPAVDPFGSVQLAKINKPDLESSFRTVASVEGASTDIGLSKIDAMVDCSSTQPGLSNIPVWVARIDMPPSVELTAAEETSHHMRDYPWQTAKTLLKGFFVLYPSAVSDPGYTTTSLSADQMIQFT